MARIHRKLFPSETTTNQTLNCYGFCDPSCPSNCYTNPDYYFFSPPPPPPQQQSNHISSYLIIILSLFTIIFLVIAFYVIKVKCYADWCGRRVNNSVPSQTDNNSEEEFHPVWLISTVGLQQSIINSITVCKYKRNEGLIEGTECSVCLNEFREDDTLRLLPKCSHAFHIACIDTWLRSHTNCPLCRAGIVVNVVFNNNNSGNTHEADVSNLGSLEQQDANLGRNQDTLLENEDGLRLTNINNMVGVNNGELENRVGTGESSDAEALVEFSTDESNSKERVLNDPIQNHGVLLGGSGHHHVVDHRGDETELDNVNLLKQDGGDYSKPCKTKRRSSIEECLHISPVIMKRSFSWNGRIVSTRGYMNLNSTLPC